MGDVARTCEGTKRRPEGDRGWSGAPPRCTRAATVARDGKDYCGQHDPEARDVRRKASQEKWQEKHDAEQKAERTRAAYAREGPVTEALLREMLDGSVQNQFGEIREEYRGRVRDCLARIAKALGGA